MRTAHKSWKSYALGAAVFTALLSTTACEPGGSDDGAGSSPSGSVSARPDAVGSATAACGDTSVSIATKFYAQDSAQHLLLTATNTGGTACALYAYPIVRFGKGGEDQVGPMGAGMRGTTIGSGEKAYAGMLLFHVDAPTDAVETMTVSLRGRGSDADADSRPIEVPLPDSMPFVNVDDNPLVTYWSVSRENTESYMFKAAGGN